VSAPSALFRIADNGNATSLAARFRANRFRLFLDLLQALPERATILDVGGTPDVWIQHREHLPKGTSVVLLNSEQLALPKQAGVASVRGDARDMSRYADRQFDICYSNSLIEHFATHQEQLTVASEIRRVSRSYFVQTPNRYFPLEPHVLFPGWQFLPIFLRTAMLQRRGFGWVPRARNAEHARTEVTSIRLLGVREFTKLFPDGSLTRERIGPLTKSFIAVRHHE
jgi:hypothetical protein